LRVLKAPTEKEMGIGRFVFSDRYSVFDWGEMPDYLNNKGAALCLIGAYFFERLEEEGIKTHYRGLVANDGKVVRLDDIKSPTNIMEINLVRVIHPEFKNGRYDYSMFAPDLTNFLLPLEIIYRNRLPQGSSVFKRLEEGEMTLDELGLVRYPSPGEKLENPIFDVSTKLEERDRYLKWEEAQRIAGLRDEEIEDIKKLLFKVNNIITKAAKKVNLINEDGKIELAYDSDRRLMVVDVVGTLDECRYSYDGLPVSKEIIRQYYKNSIWYRDVERAKKAAEEKGEKNWKSLCKSKPEKLNPKLKRIIENIYASVSNAFLEREFFDAPDLEEVLVEYKCFVRKF